jgi:hypothetical protein
VPSIYALLVLTAGLILVHFGLKEVEAQLATIVNTPIVYNPPGSPMPNN